MNVKIWPAFTQRKSRSLRNVTKSVFYQIYLSINPRPLSALELKLSGR